MHDRVETVGMKLCTAPGFNTKLELPEWYCLKNTA
jgi:hypothetical protein